MLRFLSTGALLLSIFTGLACEDAETAIDCTSICENWRDCFDSNYNVSACSDRCQDKAHDDRDARDAADACNDCLEDRSCGGQVVSCTTECAGIILESN